MPRTRRILSTPLAGALVALAVGAAPAHAQGLQRSLDRVVDAGVPGAALLVREDGRTRRLASGLADVARRRAVRPGDRFRVGSITKTFVAVRTLQLAGAGALSLDDSVERWLPGVVPGGAGISVRQLLQQTSGLFDYTADERVLAPYLAGDLAYVWAPRALAEIAASHPPVFPPGQRWEYSNTNYLLLGLLVEAAGGAPIDAQLRDHIIRPLGLRATELPSGQAIAGAHAHGYTLFERPPFVDITALHPSWGWAAGALVSTADDLARFYRALLGGRLLAPALLRQMTSTVAMGTPGERYGLGLWKTQHLNSQGFTLQCGAAWGHNGDLPGYSAFAFASRDARHQFVLLLNTDPESMKRSAQLALRRVIAHAYCG